MKRQLTAEEEFILIRMVDAKMAITKEKLKKKVSAVKDETASLNTALLSSSIYNIKDSVRKTSFYSMFEESVEDKETPERVEESSASCPQRRRSNRTCHQPWLLVRPPSTESVGRERANSGCSAAIRYTHN